MHVISYKVIRDFIEKHADAKSPLTSWYKIVSKENDRFIYYGDQWLKSASAGYILAA